jgi:hypothetical protein
VAWLEVVAPWLDFAAVVEVLIGWWRCSLGMSPNAGYSAPSTMVGGSGLMIDWVVVDGFLRWCFIWVQALAHSPGWHVRVIFQLTTWWAPNVGINSRSYLSRT